MKEPEDPAEFIKSFKDLDSDAQIKIITDLQKRREPGTVALLISLLSIDDEIVRYCVVDNLGSLGDSRAVPSLIDIALNDQSHDVRWCAVDVLGRLKDRHAVKPLLDMLTTEHNPSLLYTIALTLGQIGDPRVIPALWALLNSTETCAQWGTAEGLYYFKDIESIEPLLHALREAHKTNDDEMMNLCLFALEERGLHSDQALSLDQIVQKLDTFTSP